MTKCNRCGKDNPAEIHTCTTVAVRMADDLRQGHFEMATFAADELCRLSAENDALRADAERYRWLRDRSTFYHTRQNTAEGERYVTAWRVVTGGSDFCIDAAIDAAIAKATGEQA